MITNAQYQFFQVLKNCHRCDPPFKVLMYLCKSLEVEIIRDEINLTYFEIWKDGGILFKGEYEEILSYLFEYTFSTEIGDSCNLSNNN